MTHSAITEFVPGKVESGRPRSTRHGGRPERTGPPRDHSRRVEQFVDADGNLDSRRRPEWRSGSTAGEIYFRALSIRCSLRSTAWPAADSATRSESSQYCLCKYSAR